MTSSGPSSLRIYTRTTLKSCIQDYDLMCLDFYDPICAINPISNETKTFKNKCEMIKDICNREIDWKLKRLGKCLKKFKRKQKPIPCPKVFNPVCAIFTGVKSTFINECLVNAENVKTGKDWKIFSQGICAEDYSSVSKPLAKRHNEKKRNLKLKEFENVFDLNEPVTFIRTPTIFHTQFIKSENLENYFNAQESQPPYENNVPNNDNQAEVTKKTTHKNENVFLQEFLENSNMESSLPSYMSSSNHAPHVPLSIQTEEDGFKAMLAGFDSYPIPTQLEPYLPENKRIPDPSLFNVDNCKLGTKQLCCSFRNKTHTFKNVCDLNLHNEWTGEDWQLQHEGPCNDCNFMCSTLLKPLCVSMNGRQFTLQNECVLKANMCKYKNRDWRVIKSDVCDEAAGRQYLQVVDKYATVAPGFRYTSKHEVTESTTRAIEVSTPSQIEENQLKRDTLATKKPNVSVRKSKAQHSSRNSMSKAEKDVIFVVNPRKKAHKVKKENKKLKELKEQTTFHTTTSSSIIDLPKIETEDGAAEKNIQNLIAAFKLKLKRSTFNPSELRNAVKEAITGDKRLSMYGHHENSIMTRLLKALDENSIKEHTTQQPSA